MDSFERLRCALGKNVLAIQHDAAGRVAEELEHTVTGARHLADLIDRAAAPIDG